MGQFYQMAQMATKVTKLTKIPMTLFFFFLPSNPAAISHPLKWSMAIEPSLIQKLGEGIIEGVIFYKSGGDHTTNVNSNSV